MFFRQMFDPKLAQYAYLVGCQQTGEALIIDPERDIDRYIDLAEAEGLRIVAVAETHIHADFLSGAREFAERFGTTTYLSGEGGEAWGSDWARKSESPIRFLRDGDIFLIGKIEVGAIHTPGHTPEHLSYTITDRGGGADSPLGLVSGDFIFVGDLGRPDLLEQAAGMHGVQEPSARELFRSLGKFTALEDHLQLWPAHGAGSTCGRALGAVPQSTIGYEKRFNTSLSVAAMGEKTFVDAILSGQPDPQTYFSRMKHQNNHGVPLLGPLPSPPRLSIVELELAIAEGALLPLDTRLDRAAFMARHLPGALFAPLNKNFNTVVGSLIEDETTPILLILADDKVEEAVRDLVRIGYDRIEGYITPETLSRYFDRGGRAEAIERITFADVARLREEPEVAVVDARFGSEFAAGHIPGAVNASYTRLPAYARERIPSGKVLLVHCSVGARSGPASSFLAREGFRVKFVDGPIAEWKKVGDFVTDVDEAGV